MKREQKIRSKKLNPTVYSGLLQHKWNQGPGQMESDVKCNQRCALMHLSDAGQTESLCDRGRMNKCSSREQQH